MKSEHTKGPWELSPAVEPRKIYSGDSVIAEVWPTTINMAEAHANAKLIASAPELLEALIELAECSPCKNGCDKNDMTCASNKARAAIAKAKGQP